MPVGQKWHGQGEGETEIEVASLATVKDFAGQKNVKEFLMGEELDGADVGTTERF